MKVQAITPTISQIKRKSTWIVSVDSPKTVDDLNFTSRNENGTINWWDVTPPKTDYWHAHQYLGRGYAFEVLDLVNNPEAEDVEGHELGCIMEAIARSRMCVSGAEGIAHGFFEVISEYVTTGTANR